MTHFTVAKNNERIHYIELNRICMRINSYLPPTIFQGYRITLPLIYATALTPNKPHSSKDFMQYKSAYGMYLCVDGTGRMIMPDECELQPGSLIVCPPGKYFEWIPGASGMVVFYFFFTIEPEIKEIRKIPKAVWPHFIQELAIIVDEYRQNLPGWSERASIRCSIMLSRVCTLLGIIKPSQPSPYLTQFINEDVDNYLLSNLAMPVRLKEIADYMGTSQRTLLRHYFQVTGKTIHKRLLELRMEKASSLLGRTLLSYIDVAIQCGFSNVNYFGKAFRQHTGITPVQYRRKAFESKR